MQQIPLDVGLADEPSLDNFFPGPNVAVVQHLRQWLQDSRPDATTYLWGPAGSGKSHLLRACCAALQARGNSVGHLDPHGAQASEFDERWVAVVMDDVHLYSPVLQQTAFSWFVQAHTLQRPVLAAGLLQPSALALREDLRTRLGWGQVLALELLTEAQTREVLRQAANARGLVLSEDVMDFTLRRFSRDLGHLMQLLSAMDRYALQTQRALTIPLVKSMLENA